MAGAVVRGEALELGERRVAVGSAAWFGWLESAERFTYEGVGGRFGARRERFQRGGWYWRAYRRVGGRLRRAYLGRAQDLTPERLERAAAELAGGAGPAPAPPPPPALLRTKLELPLRPGLVERGELCRRLDQALAHRLTVVTAPTGWGKTTAVAQWAARLRDEGRAEVAWLSLDPDDDDPARLWSYVCGALAPHEPGVAAAEAAFRSPRIGSASDLLAGLINALAASPARPPLLLVLDDFHALASPVIHEALVFLIDRMPARLRVAITSRSHPPLPLARWRAAGQAFELGPDDLRFGLADSGELLAGVSGAAVAPDAVRTLVDRTEGWAAGLHLAALALRGAGGRPPAELVEQISGGHHYITDYMAGEILGRQPPDLRDFLLRTSVLDRFCAELCDALLDGGRPAAELLARAEQASLFLVPLDSERRWFRYHQLFADALRALLRRTDPQLAAEMRRRASAWFARQAAAGDATALSPAVELALAAGAHAQAAEVIGAGVEELLWRRGEVQTIQRWMAAIPDEVRQEFPRAALAEAWALLARVRLDTVRLRLGELERFAAGDPLVAGEVAAIRSFAERIEGHLDASLFSCGRALELLRPQQRAERYLVLVNLANVHMMLGDMRATRAVLSEIRAASLGSDDSAVLVAAANVRLLEAGLLRSEGRAPEAERLVRQTLADAGGRVGALTPVGMAYIALSEVRYDRGDLEEAERYARLAFDHGEEWWNYDLLLMANEMLGRAARARGDVAQAQGFFARAQELALTYEARAITEGVRFWEAWEALARGELARVEQSLAERGVLGGEPTPERYEEFELLARLELARGRPVAAADLAQRLRALAERGGHVVRQVVMSALLARALAALGLADQAAGELLGALDLAARGDIVRALLDEGEDLRPPLERAAARLADAPDAAARRAFVGRLLRELGAQAAAPPDLLTARELEVLRLAAAGESNTAIAGRLVVSLHTVKKHLTHILAKLDAPSRTAAVARARERGLI